MNTKKKIKSFFSPFINHLVAGNFSWKILSFFVRIGRWMSFERSRYERQKAEKKLTFFFQHKIVQNGFFKGLKYKGFSSVGSSIFPKLLGSYEIELLPVLNDFKKNSYQKIIDVGCAEGYYAVGLALNFPQADVYAFDIDKTALKLCEELAIYNGVSSQLIFNERCTHSTLANFNFTGRSLLVCDCEGYERALFTTGNCSKLKHTDLIIELHPFIAKDVKTYLMNLFGHSHTLQVINSLDNNRKISEFGVVLLGLSALEQVLCVEEGRPYTMDWLIAVSKMS